MDDVSEHVYTSEQFREMLKIPAGVDFKCYPLSVVSDECAMGNERSVTHYPLSPTVADPDKYR